MDAVFFILIGVFFGVTFMGTLRSEDWADGYAAGHADAVAGKRSA